MKRQIIISIAVLLLIFLLCVTVVPINAQTKDNSQIEQNAWIKYEGLKRERMSFDLTCYNPTGKKLCVIVFDENHNSLFKGFYNDKNFHKKFEIPLGEETNKLSFELRSSKDLFLTQSFKINSEMKMDVVVTKL
jgi:hypothetical protein